VTLKIPRTFRAPFVCVLYGNTCSVNYFYTIISILAVRFRSCPLSVGTLSKHIEQTMAPKRKESASSSKNGGEKGSKKQKLEDGTKSQEDSNKKDKAKKEEGAGGDTAVKHSAPSLDKQIIECSATSKTGEKWNLKIASWNVNGLRAVIQKHGLGYLEKEDPDILCVQETKCSKEKIPLTAEAKGYTAYWLSGDTEGYSGVGVYTKKKPISVKYGIGMDKHDKEGRVITAEYDKFYLVNVYVPNAGKKLVRLDYRMEWDKDFRSYLQRLDQDKCVVLCGDLNVSHKEIDLANPKNNKRNAGFTQEERDGFSALLEAGFVDSYRHLYPDLTGAYTFWTYMMNSRAKNVGWRLDYFVLSERLLPNLCESAIRSQVPGSDHCPVTLFLAL